MFYDLFVDKTRLRSIELDETKVSKNEFRAFLFSLYQTLGKKSVDYLRWEKFERTQSYIVMDGRGELLFTLKPNRLKMFFNKMKFLK